MCLDFNFPFLATDAGCHTPCSPSQVEASDLDEGVNSEVTYRIYETNSSKAFELLSVNPTTGEVTVAQSIHSPGDSSETLTHSHSEISSFTYFPHSHSERSPIQTVQVKCGGEEHQNTCAPSIDLWSLALVSFAWSIII